MSLEIQAVHAKLKEAIQNHQRLVGLRQGQEDDEALKQQLLAIQAEILHWSREQKKICQAIHTNYGVVSKAQAAQLQPPSTTAGGPTPTPPPSQAPQAPPSSTQILSSAPTLTVVSVPVAHVQGGKPAVSQKSSMPPPDSMRSRRTLSDSDMREYRDNTIRAIVERKQLSPKAKKKLEFMACLNLITPETLKEVQNKRSERKRRSTANPQFSYHFEPDRKHFKNYLVNSSLNGGKRPRGRPPKQSPTNSHPSSPDSPSTFHFKNGFVRNGTAEVESQEEVCAKCGQDVPSLQCHSCRLFYHEHCLDSPPSPVTAQPTTTWTCPKCSTSNHRSLLSNPVTLAKVNTYIANKAAKEDERRKVQKKNADLQNEISQLEAKDKEMRDTHNAQLEEKKRLEQSMEETQKKVTNLEGFIRQFKA